MQPFSRRIFYRVGVIVIPRSFRQCDKPEASMSGKKAADVMTRELKTIPADATVRDAAILLSAHKISGAPVVDADGKMVGIISESDLLSKARLRHALPPVAAFGLVSPP